MVAQDKHKRWTIPATIEGARIPKGFSEGDQPPRSYNIRVGDNSDEMLRGRRFLKARKLQESSSNHEVDLSDRGMVAMDRNVRLENSMSRSWSCRGLSMHEGERTPISIMKRAGYVSRPKSVSFSAPVEWVPLVPRKNPRA